MKSFISLLLLLSAFSVGAETIQEGRWTTAAEVTSVEIHDNSIYRVVTNTTDNTSAVCASENGTYWWPATDALAKEYYSTALAAFASGKRISVVYKDDCNIASKRLTHIMVNH